MSSNGKDALNSELKILEAYTRDVGRGIARIDYDSMDSLNASTGDILEIKTYEKSKGISARKNKTVAKCLPLYPSDEGKGIIRIDGIIRNNAGLAIGDIAHIRKIKVKPAEKVIVAPLDAIPPIDERYLSDSLESVSMTKGDNFIVPYFGGRLVFDGDGAHDFKIPGTDICAISEIGDNHRGYLGYRKPVNNLTIIDAGAIDVVVNRWG